MPKNSKRKSLKARFWKLELDTFLTLCETVGTPRAITCYMLAKGGEWAQYLDLARPDLESQTFPDDYLVTECMSKNKLLPRGSFGESQEAVALRKWESYEDRCRETNLRISNYLNYGVPLGDAEVEDVITKATSLIGSWLDELDSSALEYAETQFRFGPGATSSSRGRDVLLSRKLTSRMDVSPNLYPYWRSVLGSGFWSRHVTDVSLLAAERMGFAPKNAEAHRTIGIQATMNIFVQLGQGLLLRQRLKRGAGVDLEHQADDNRRRASLCESTGDATIDLKGASDCICRMLVWLLFPVRWASFLDVSRMEFITMPDGTERRLEKWSAMGNGYTFELETLIFLGLARACDDNAVAFGDDIILHREKAPLLIRVLELLGFSTNSKKTFLAGRFFESCGHDYWRGINVRPIYLKGTYVDYPSAVIRIANKIRRYASARNLHLGCDSRFRHAWVSVTNASPIAQRTGVPLGVGDGGLIRNYDEATPPSHKGCRNARERKGSRHLKWCRCPRCGHQGFLARVWRTAPLESDNTDPIGAVCAALAWGSPKVSRNREFTRGRFSKGGFSTQAVFSWPEIGPWV